VAMSPLKIKWILLWRLGNSPWKLVLPNPKRQSFGENRWKLWESSDRFDLQIPYFKVPLKLFSGGIRGSKHLLTNIYSSAVSTKAVPCYCWRLWVFRVSKVLPPQKKKHGVFLVPATTRQRRGFKPRGFTAGFFLLDVLKSLWTELV